AYLRDFRWFAQKSTRGLQMTIVAAPVFTLADRQWAWPLIQAKAGENAATYSMPVTESWTSGVPNSATPVLAKLRKGPQEGYLSDALLGEPFIRAVVDAAAADRTIDTPEGQIRFHPTAAFAAMQRAEKPLRIGGPEQSNSSAIIEDTLVIKFYRRVAAG